ncbi:MAG: CapA family protein [Prevotellaceae bacterium]|jgi:poly-gamma-glutamate synthesis protein (capsule biosynthesis protein)|nr:CapA family protein [Prevotellaceae bacterium]
MKRIFLFAFICFVFTNHSFASDTLRLVFIGDIMQHSPQINAAKMSDGTYNYDSCFSFVASEIKYADFKVANLELTLSGAPYSGYPCFSAPDAIAETLKKTGINLLSTANNHSCDRGSKGITRTLDVLDELGIYHAGTYRNIAEKIFSHPQIVDIKGLRIAFLSYTYGTNGLPFAYPNIVNLIDTTEIAKDIKLAKKYNPDMIICLIHWGLEYQLKQNDEQKTLAQFMISRGINLIIGSHPHVVQPMEAQIDNAGNIKSAVVYSLGNAVSNQNYEHTDIGAIAHVSIVKNDTATKIIDCKYSLILRHRPVENGKTKFYIIPSSKFYTNHQLFTAAEYAALRKTLENTRKRLNAHNKNFVEKID